MQLVLISGLSGSGKSIALNVLEDAGYFCVDNLPSALLCGLTDHLKHEGHHRVAVAIDMRGGRGIADLPTQLTKLGENQVAARFIFLDARDDVLIQRFSETRRRHPLAMGNRTLAEAIAEERTVLEVLKARGHRIDTSYLRPNALRAMIKDFIDLAGERPQLTLLFESFGFKHGLPLDADLVFDVRCLPNPHYDPILRPLTGRDPAVIDFLESQAEVQKLRGDIQRFLEDWLPAFVRDNRSYMTVAIGCTGGQHRSVWFAEKLAEHFRCRVENTAAILVRHRTLAE
jgi:UPF0042 nucleotide-binding protein